MMKNGHYDFPVELQDCYSDKGKEIPGVKTVVRLDTNDPISSVSPRYRLITHAEAMGAATKLLEKLGLSDTKVNLNTSGSHLCAVAEYKNITKALDVGDTAGLRMIVRNSYDRTSSFNLRLGLLILSCKNGMVSHRDYFNLKIRHSGAGKLEYRLPDPEYVYDALDQEVANINSFSTSRLEDPDLLVWEAKRKGLLTNDGVDYVLGQRREDSTVWDMLQAFTNFTTHQREVNPIAREALLERTSRYFDHMINGNGYYDLLLEEKGGEDGSIS